MAHLTTKQIKQLIEIDGAGPGIREEVQSLIAKLTSGGVKRTTSPLGENEYRVPVSYDMPRNKRKLEAEFSKGGVSELFYGSYEWQPHSSCAVIDQTPGNRVMLLKHFGRITTSKENIAEMDNLGYRSATHLEAYAFAKANPELQRQFSIAALGSFTLDGHNRFIALLYSFSGSRILDHTWFADRWDSDRRFLFVRK